MKQNKMTIEGDKFRIILHQEKSEKGSTTIDACTSKNGSLTVGGYDLGPSVKELMGKSDYEYDATVAAEDKNSLYSALQKELFNGHEDFSSWLDENGIHDIEASFNVVLLLMLKKLGHYPHEFDRWAQEHDIEVNFWTYP